SPQPVAEHRVTVLGEDGLGMELHPLEFEAAVANAHDGSVSDRRSDLQLRRQARGLEGERVIAADLESLRQPFEDAHAQVLNGTRLAVHDLRGADDTSPQGLSQG